MPKKAKVGPPKGNRNRCIWSDGQAQELLHRMEAGESQRELARELETSAQTLNDLYWGETYPELLRGERGDKATHYVTKAQVKWLRVQVLKHDMPTEEAAAEIGVEVSAACRMLTGEAHPDAGGPMRKKRSRATASPELDAQILRASESGQSQRQIAYVLGISAPFVNRRLQEMRGKIR